ncbi:hypothetical protein P153DRAFT_435841 [Dothidotthia symphoricarpi CBS 119687]|uniref:Uncharacterized protein n=1 Tax=Dothidotthia symphoricarpi CBS 119687 TaxID=1392245 RepID=A0A6A5ZXH2_9PLEO|nr:uncharacterized protein P153DRAFT_435841 [Dothidotthia symphoricarpi CBS 119687]KAF2123603.1 hypothetical protein P153DRAFT_435841 [Dothidotthia symphoricarpi CBS 119687]
MSNSPKVQQSRHEELDGLPTTEHSESGTPSLLCELSRDIVNRDSIDFGNDNAKVDDEDSWRRSISVDGESGSEDEQEQEDSDLFDAEERMLKAEDKWIRAHGKLREEGDMPRYWYLLDHYTRDAFLYIVRMCSKVWKVKLLDMVTDDTISDFAASSNWLVANLERLIAGEYVASVDIEIELNTDLQAIAMACHYLDAPRFGGTVNNYIIKDFAACVRILANTDYTAELTNIATELYALKARINAHDASFKKLEKQNLKLKSDYVKLQMRCDACDAAYEELKKQTLEYADNLSKLEGLVTPQAEENTGTTRFVAILPTISIPYFKTYKLKKYKVFF